MAGKQASQNFEIKESTVEVGGDSELLCQGKIVHYLTVDLWTKLVIVKWWIWRCSVTI